MATIKTARSSSAIPLSLWDRIELVVGEEGHQGIYVSRIEDIGKENLIVSKPDFIGGKTLLTANSRVYIHFMRPDALYRFSASLKVLPDRSGGEVQLHSFGSVERVQRRQFVRVSFRSELRYAFLNNISAGIGLSEIKWYNSYTSNISAGGLLMKADDKVKKSDLILIKLGKYQMMGIPRLVAAICCRIVRLEDGRFAGVEFITDRMLAQHFSANEIAQLPSQVKSFTSHIQNNIVKYIFEQQVRERQKGLL
jgi:c-di-GMP-binding flagellar brake protein YcgR